MTKLGSDVTLVINKTSNAILVLKIQDDCKQKAIIYEWNREKVQNLNPCNHKDSDYSTDANCIFQFEKC